MEIALNGDPVERLIHQDQGTRRCLSSPKTLAVALLLPMKRLQQLQQPQPLWLAKAAWKWFLSRCTSIILNRAPAAK